MEQLSHVPQPLSPSAATAEACAPGACARSKRSPYLLPLEKVCPQQQRPSTTINKCVLGLGAQLCPTLCDPMDCSQLGSSVHGDSPGKNARVGCHALLQGIFPSQGSNPGFLHCCYIYIYSLPQGTLSLLLLTLRLKCLCLHHREIT